GAWMNGDRAQWIAASPLNVPMDAGDHAFFTTFDLTGFDPDTADITIHAQRSAAESGSNSLLYQDVKMYLNGVLVPQLNQDTFNSGGLLFHATSGFRPGINSLDFVIRTMGRHIEYRGMSYGESEF